MRSSSAQLLRASALALLAHGALAPAVAADPYTSDKPGGADHRLLSRYQGSILFMYGHSAAASAQFIFDDKGKPTLRPAEGRVDSRIYWGPKGRSPLEVYRNYRQALEAGGFEILYACETRQCEADDVQPMVQELPRTASWKESNPFVSGIFNSGSQPGFHYVSARRNGPNGPTYVAVALVGGFDDRPVFGRVRQFVQIVEPARIEMNKVTVDARAIQAGLQRDGKLALYGVTFDTNQAVLRDESTAQLTEMASVLKAAPALKVFIVGHTDNQGQFQANLQLSQKRADAVVAALGTRHGIAPARLIARGVANLSPVASNDAEPGRARNRRVEMVVR